MESDIEKPCEVVAARGCGNAASVKVVETYPKSIYIDSLNLLQLNNKWTIVNKIYTSRAR